MLASEHRCTNFRELCPKSDDPWYEPQTLSLANQDMLPDFSSVGCDVSPMTRSQMPIFRICFSPTSPDCDRTKEIQDALVDLSKRSLDDQGFRGVVEFAPGEYRIDGDGFTIEQSGIVIRGLGVDPTTQEPLVRFRCTSTKPGTVLFKIQGKPSPDKDEPKSRIPVPPNVERIPVGAIHIPLAKVDGLAVGDTIAVVRNGNAEWLREIGTQIGSTEARN